MQRRGDRRAIRRESVSGDLEWRAGRSLTQAFHEYIAGLLIALTHRDVENQLAVSLDSNPHIAVSEKRAILRTDALLLFSDEAPNLVTFHVAYFHVPNLFGHDALALLTGLHQEFQDRGVMNSRGTPNTRNGVAFEQEANNHFCLLDWQVHAVKRSVVRLGERLSALAATKALKPIAMLSKTLALGAAIVAGHFGLELSSGRSDNESGPTIQSLGFGLRLNPVSSSNYLPGLVFAKQSQRDRKFHFSDVRKGLTAQRYFFSFACGLI